MGNILFTKGSASGGDRSSKRDIVGAQIDPNILAGEDAEYSTLAEVELKKMFAGKVVATWNMSCSEKNRGGDEGEYEKPVLRKSVEDDPKLVSHNGSITCPQLTIDESLLVDPKLLFIGSKIGEGAHGKVYEGSYLCALWGEEEHGSDAV
ncbi:unnamed protein product [Camellia sinensis]